MYNGLDITQYKHFTKVSCSTYIRKNLKDHHWDTPNMSSLTKTPLPRDSKFIKELDHTTHPTEVVNQISLYVAIQFKYNQAIGELLFDAVTCQPDILFTVTKISQYSKQTYKNSLPSHQICVQMSSGHISRQSPLLVTITARQSYRPIDSTSTT